MGGRSFIWSDFVIVAVLIFVYNTSRYIHPVELNHFFKETGIGDKIDSLDGVYVYYNGAVSHVEGRNYSLDGYMLGLKFQCVEFVKRYYYLHFHHKMPNVYGHAKDFFDSKVKDGGRNYGRNLIQFRNPGKMKPKKGDILVFSPTQWNAYGHVAIVSDVSESGIEYIQQNPGPFAPSRITVSLEKKSELYIIKDSDLICFLRK